MPSRTGWTAPPPHLVLDRAELGVGEVDGAEDDLAVGAVLGLREQVRRHVRRVGRLVGHDLRTRCERPAPNRAREPSARRPPSPRFGTGRSHHQLGRAGWHINGHHGAAVVLCGRSRRKHSVSADQRPPARSLLLPAPSPSADLHEHLGRRDVLVAWPANLVHLGHRLGAVGHGKDGLCATGQHNVRRPDLRWPHAARAVPR